MNNNNSSNFGADLKKYVKEDKDIKYAEIKLGGGITICASVLNIEDKVKETSERCM